MLKVSITFDIMYYERRLEMNNTELNNKLYLTKHRMKSGIDKLFNKINSDKDVLEFKYVLQDLNELELEISRKIQKM